MRAVPYGLLFLGYSLLLSTPAAATPQLPPNWEYFANFTNLRPNQFHKHLYLLADTRHSFAQNSNAHRSLHRTNSEGFKIWLETSQGVVNLPVVDWEFTFDSRNNDWILNINTSTTTQFSALHFEFHNVDRDIQNTSLVGSLRVPPSQTFFGTSGPTTVYLHSSPPSQGWHGLPSAVKPTFFQSAPSPAHNAHLLAKRLPAVFAGSIGRGPVSAGRPMDAFDAAGSTDLSPQARSGQAAPKALQPQDQWWTNMELATRRDRPKNPDRTDDALEIEWLESPAFTDGETIEEILTVVERESRIQNLGSRAQDLRDFRDRFEKALTQYLRSQLSDTTFASSLRYPNPRTGLNIRVGFARGHERTFDNLHIGFFVKEMYSPSGLSRYLRVARFSFCETTLRNIASVEEAYRLPQ